MDLERLNKALATYEVAEHIYKVDNGKTLSEALAMLEAANANDDDQEIDPATIKGAVKIANEAGEQWRAKPIKLGVNRSKVRFNGVSAKPDAPTKTFNSIVNKSTSDFNRLTAEDGELPWASKSRSKVQIIKDAVRKSQEAKRINEVRARLPKEFSDSGLLPAQRQKNNVSSQLPSEWQDAKASALAKQKSGQLKTWNDASRSLEHQPNPEKSPLDDPQEYDQNTNIPNVDGMTRTALPQPNVKGPKNGKSIGAQTQKTHPNQEKQGFPKRDIEFDSIESGRGYY